MTKSVKSYYPGQMSITKFAILGLFLFSFSPALAEAKIKKEVKAHFKTADVFAPVDMDEIRDEEPAPMTGVVSWYGPGFNRHRTASGERYNMQDLTCASRDLPFGTRLEITNVANQEKVIVRVNDRGPFVRSRILDLSYGAAKRLGFVGGGTAKVEVREVREIRDAMADDLGHR